MVYLGGIWYSLLILLLALIGLFEFFRMAGLNPIGFASLIGYVAMLSILWSSLSFSDYLHAMDSGLLLPALFVLLFYTVLRRNQFHIEHVALTIIGALYIGFGFAYLAATRIVSADGFYLTILVLLGIWSTDSGAYFTGKFMGKRKLWPAISPNKTIEGSLGGLLASLIVVVAIDSIVGVLPLMQAAAVGIVIGITAQVGDLVESAIKRHFDVKDSGHILPGHGGVLDRVDSWLVVFPLLHVLHLL